MVVCSSTGLRARSDIPGSEAAADVHLGTVAVADQLEAKLSCGTVCRDPIADHGRAVTDGGQALGQEVDQRALVALLEMADAFPVERLVDFAHRVLPFFFQAEDGIRDGHVTGVQTCALPI